MTLAGWFVLAVSAFTWVGQQPEVAELGPWSPRALHVQTPIGRGPAIGALVVLAATGAWALPRVTRTIQALRAVRRAERELPTTAALVVLDTDIPDAFTTPGAGGRIVVTRGMMRRLSADERSALLAHERSHLGHRHSWWILIMDLTADANPLLTPTARAVRLTTERWADEDAAAELGDRPLVARALGRAALARSSYKAHAAAGTTAATGGDVPSRVQSLLHPPVFHLRRGLAVLASLLMLVSAGSVTVERQGEHLFESAGASSAHDRFGTHGTRLVSEHPHIPTSQPGGAVRP
nr:M56 family metallopeptidase [Actinopolymorpha pittospori]